MRRCILLTLLSAGLFFNVATPALHAETPGQHDAAEEHSEFRWHLINSVIFGAAFLWAIWKYSPAFFNARSADIQKAIQDATGLKMQADLRYSEIDRQMAKLPEEVGRMREQAKAEMEREHQRRQGETQHDLQQIEASLQAQIAGARAESERQIRRTAAMRAVDSAERQLQERAGASTSEGMVDDFIHLVERGKN